MPTPFVSDAIRALGIISYGLAAMYMLLRAGLGFAYAQAGRARWQWYIYSLSTLAFAAMFAALTLIAIAPGGVDATVLAVAARICVFVGALTGWIALILSLRGEWRREHDSGDSRALFDEGEE